MSLFMEKVFNIVFHSLFIQGILIVNLDYQEVKKIINAKWLQGKEMVEIKKKMGEY